MAGKFVLTAELNIQAPNMQRVVQQIQQQLGKVQVNISVPNAPKVQQQVSKVNKTLKNTGVSAKQAAKGFNTLSSSIGKSIGALIRYDIARKVINLFSQALEQGISDAIKFEREMNRVAQVTGKTMAEIKGLEVEITRLSTSLGVSSMSLIKVTRVLAQTGITANEVKIALDALAKTTLAPTFDDIANTTETAIAAMRQFRLEAKDLEGLLGSINKVAGQFAVEAGDIGVAIRRAGGAFRSAGGEVEELIALFTSVRSTTRETAETIATGFRTIFTRMQRPTTIKFLRQFGVELQDMEGKFVGPFEAVKRLNIALKQLDPRDVRYSQIVEQLGGFRQVSKVIPLIQEFDTAQRALNVAQKGSGSLAGDAAKAQATFAVKIEKLKQEVKELFRVITESKAFRGMLDLAIGLAKAFTNVATALGPIVPLLTAIFAIKGIGMLGGILGGIGRGFKNMGARGYARGGIVPGTGTGDTVPAMLSPGEFVIKKSSVQAFGSDNLERINGYARGGQVEYTGTHLQGGTSADISRRIVTGKGKTLLENLRGKPDVASQKFNTGDLIKANIVPMRFDYTVLMRGNKVVSDPTSSGAKWEKLVGKKLGTEVAPLPRIGNAIYPIDFVKGSGVYEAKKGAWQNKEIFDKLLRHRIQSETLPKGWTAGENTKSIGRINVAIPGARETKQLSKKIGKKASGGVITAQGTDSIPALLTPGEFVINRKSAQRVGYGNLGAINRYASGGMVGQQRRRMAGGGMMDLFMMNSMMGSGGGGGQSGAEQADDQLSNLARTTKTASKTVTGFRGGLGAVTSGLGQVAGASLMTYAKVQFMGQMADQVATSLGIENETIHKVITGLTTFVSVVYAAGIAISMMARVQMLQGIQAIFGSPVIKAVAGGVGQLIEFVGLAVLMAGKKVIPKKMLGAMSRGWERTKGRVRGGVTAGRGVITRAKGVLGDMRTLKMANKLGITRSDLLAKEAFHMARTNVLLEKQAFLASKIKGGAGLDTRVGTAMPKGLGRMQKTRVLRAGKGNYSRSEATMADLAKLISKEQAIAGQAGRVAGSTTKMAVAGNVAKGLGKMALKIGPIVIALAVMEHMLSKSAKAQEDSIQDAAKAGASWDEVGLEVRQMAGTKALQGALEAGGTILALKSLTTVVAATAQWLGILNAVPVFGQVAYIIATLAVTAYAMATFVDAVNDARMNFKRVKFAAEVTRLQGVFQGFEKGIVSTTTAALELNSGLDTLKKQAGDIGEEQNTGGILGVGSGGFWGTDQELIDAANKEWVAAHQMMIDMIPKIVGKAQLDALANMKPIEKGGTQESAIKAAEEEFIKSLGGYDQMERQALRMGTTFQSLMEDFREAAEITHKVVEANHAYEEASKKTTQALLSAMDVMLGIASLDPTIGRFQAAFSNIAGQVSGGFGAAASPDISPQFSKESIMAISTDAQWDELAKNARMVAASLGAAGKLIADEFLGSAKLMTVLPEAMTELANDLSRLDFEGGADPGEKMMELLKEKLGDADFAAIPQFLKDKLKAQINAMTAGAEGENIGEKFAENQAAILAEMTDNIDVFVEAIQAASAALTKYDKMLGNALSQLSQLNNDMRSNRQGRVDMEFEGKQRVARARGGDLTSGDYAARFQKRKAAGLAGVMGRDPITGKETATKAADMGVQDLGKLYLTQKKMLDASNRKLEDLRKKAGGAGAAADGMAETMRAAREENAALKEQTEQTKQALMDYTNVQQRLTGIQAELAKAESARLAKRGALTEFTFASDKDRGSIVEGMQAAFKAIQAGDLGAVDDTQRAAVGQFLDRFENVSLEAFGGKTGGELKKEFEIAELEKIMGRELTGEERKGIMESTSEEERLIAEMERLQQEAMHAQDALLKGLEVDREALTSKIEELNKTFLEELKEILVNRMVKREEGKLRSAEKEQKQIQEQQKKANEVLKQAMGAEDFDAMQTRIAGGGEAGEVAKRRKDELLKGLTTSKAAIKVLKEKTGAEQAANRVAKAFRGKGDDDYSRALISGSTTRTLKEGGFSIGKNLTGARQLSTFDDISATAKSRAFNIGGRTGGDVAAESSAIMQKALVEMQKSGMTVEQAVTAAGGGVDLLQAFKDEGFGATEDFSGAGIDAKNMAEVLAHFIERRAMTAGGEAKRDVDAARSELKASGFDDAQITRIMQQSDDIYQKLAMLPEGSTFKKFGENLEELANKIKTSNDLITDLRAAPVGPTKVHTPPVTPGESAGAGITPVHPWTGGLIGRGNITYRARGGGIFTPKGTDTVPAMLTPGEYVIRRDAVKAVGIPALQSINGMGKSARGFSSGGRVGYYAHGGQVGGRVDFSGLDASMNRFSQQVARLSEVLGKGFSVNVGGTIDVNVRLSGAEMLEGAKDALGELAVQKVQDGINNMLKTYFPQLNRKSGLHNTNANAKARDAANNLPWQVGR